jgi:hypothetical protein
MLPVVGFADSTAFWLQQLAAVKHLHRLVGHKAHNLHNDLVAQLATVRPTDGVECGATGGVYEVQHVVFVNHSRICGAGLVLSGLGVQCGSA